MTTLLWLHLKLSQNRGSVFSCHSGLEPESSDVPFYYIKTKNYKLPNCILKSLDTGCSLPRTPIRGRYDLILRF
jgi:hypothetical protein